jgi:hypothetical protein
LARPDAADGTALSISLTLAIVCAFGTAAALLVVHAGHEFCLRRRPAIDQLTLANGAFGGKRRAGSDEQKCSAQECEYE